MTPLRMISVMTGSILRARAWPATIWPGGGETPVAGPFCCRSRVTPSNSHPLYVAELSANHGVALWQKRPRSFNASRRPALSRGTYASWEEIRMPSNAKARSGQITSAACCVRLALLDARMQRLRKNITAERLREIEDGWHPRSCEAAGRRRARRHHRRRTAPRLLAPRFSHPDRRSWSSRKATIR